MEKFRTGAEGVSGDLARSGEDSLGPSGLVVDWNGCMVALWTRNIFIMGYHCLTLYYHITKGSLQVTSKVNVRGREFMFEIGQLGQTIFDLLIYLRVLSKHVNIVLRLYHMYR